MSNSASRVGGRSRGPGRFVEEVSGGDAVSLPGFHVGIGLGSVVLPWSRDDGNDTRDSKQKEIARAQWLDALAATPVSADYEPWFKSRWKPAVAQVAAREVKTTGRMLVGAGDPSMFDVGLRVHHTWGVPIIPGSSLKGLVSHWLDVVYGPDPGIDVNPLDPGHPEKERALYRRPTFPPGRSTPKFGPGEAQRVIFGAPEVGDDLRFQPNRRSDGRPVHHTSCRGRVHFHDALLVPGSGSAERPFAVDVLTPHHSLYQRGYLAANDYESPVPVSFLSVNRGVRFLVAVTADRGYDAWAEFAIGHLCDALADWGVGSKTAAGYGRCEMVADATLHVTDADLKEEVKKWLAEKFASLSATPEGPQKFVAEIGQAWGDRLGPMTPQDRATFVKAVESFLADLKKSKQLVGKPYEAYRLAVKALEKP